MIQFPYLNFQIREDLTGFYEITPSPIYVHILSVNKTQNNCTAIFNIESDE